MAGLINSVAMSLDGVIGPVKRPYGGARLSMRLLEAKQFDSGVTLLRYEPIGRTPPQ